MTTDTTVIGGYEHYLTSNGVRTFVGPVRHRATRRISKARAAIAARLNRSKENPVTDQPTIVIPAIQESDPNDTTQGIGRFMEQVTESLRGMNLPTFTVNPPKPDGYKGKARRSRWAEVKEAVMDRLYDSAWHEMVRNAAGTAGYVALVALSVVVFGKAVVWVVFL